MGYLSTRTLRRIGDPEWADYADFLGLPNLTEIRTIDSWCNPHAEGSKTWGFPTLDEALQAVWCEKLLPIPVAHQQYHQLFTEASMPNLPQGNLGLQFLGYDLSDDTWKHIRQSLVRMVVGIHASL
jgi:hypothetical protein